MSTKRGGHGLTEEQKHIVCTRDILLSRGRKVRDERECEKLLVL